ncbi:MAG: helix-hairpin-helix domain-containing protein [Patescibacteria group bacterium]|jgi:DNA polymerase (family 10)
MLNQDLALIFNNMADYLDMMDVPFKPVAFRRVSQTLETLAEDVGDIYKKSGLKGLEEIPGVGINIANKIVEYMQTGKIESYEELKRATPVDLENLGKIAGLGPKKIKALYNSLGVKNIEDLKKEILAHTISKLPNFGEKSEQNIATALGIAQTDKGRIPLNEIVPHVDEVLHALQKFPEVNKVTVAGSVRRKKTTIGDVDFLAVVTDVKKVMDYFTHLPMVATVWGVGETKASVATKYGFDMDLRIVPEESFGAALQYFTGSKEHNIKVRKIAQKMGFKLNEYGLYKGKKLVAGNTEEEIYAKLNLPYPQPEEREE